MVNSGKKVLASLTRRYLRCIRCRKGDAAREMVFIKAGSSRDPGL